MLNTLKEVSKKIKQAKFEAVKNGTTILEELKSIYDDKQEKP